MIKAVKKRIVQLDVMTGLAMLLVVIGHHKFLRPIVSWFDTFDMIIYSFHMAFFMFISGFIINLSYPTENFSYKVYICRKLRKFIPPYLLVGILATLLKYSSGKELFQDIFYLIFNPLHGKIQIIWYIYVLMILYSVSPFIIKLINKSNIYSYILIAISIIMTITHRFITDYFCLNMIFRLFIFYILGIISFNKVHDIQKIKIIKWIVLSIPFIFIESFFIIKNIYPHPFYITGVLSLPFCILISKIMYGINVIRFLLVKISKYVFQIYLWQMFFINAIWLTSKYLIPLDFISSYGYLYIFISSFLTIVLIITAAKSYVFILKKYNH